MMAPQRHGSVTNQDRTANLLAQAEAAARANRDSEARRLFNAVLRYEPTNDRALVALVYLADDAHDSLHHLARLLDVYPDHPNARMAIRWVRRRVPTSSPRALPTAAAKGSRPVRSRDRLIYVLPLLAVLTGVGMLWALSRSPATPVQAGGAQNQDREQRSLSTPEALAEIIQIAIPLFTPTPMVTPTPSPIPTATPDSAWVGMIGRPQTKNLSCESRSAADMAGFWGITIEELDFLAALGASDNPHVGFVGDVDDPPGSLPPFGYGVYAEPVAATLREFGLDARPIYELGLDGLRSELLAGRPVLVWATYGMELYEPLEWISTDGYSSTVVPFMHTFIVTGFDQETLTVLDAYDATVQRYASETFLRAWNQFDQMSLVITGPLQ